jgi:hypothetical protein
MVAVAVLDELQVTCAVMSLVVESAYVPVAVNCLVVPRMIVGLTVSRRWKSGPGLFRH